MRSTRDGLLTKIHGERDLMRGWSGNAGEESPPLLPRCGWGPPCSRFTSIDYTKRSGHCVPSTRGFRVQKQILFQSPFTFHGNVAIGSGSLGIWPLSLPESWAAEPNPKATLAKCMGSRAPGRGQGVAITRTETHLCSERGS